jgi:hypothetical protein
MTTLPPPGWYPDPSGAPGTRYWDGRRWAATAAPPPKKNNALLIVGVVGGVFALLIVGLLILGAIGSSLHDKKPAAPGATPSFPIPTVPSKLPTPSTPSTPTASIGQEVRDGQFAFTVTSIDRSKQAGDLSNQFEVVTAQGEFVNVRMTVTNIGNHAQTFYATNQHLKIGNNTYDANTMAALWTSSSNETINPGNSIQVVVSFDVPPGAGGGALQLHDSVFSGGTQVTLP